MYKKVGIAVEGDGDLQLENYENEPASEEKELDMEALS
jgi:steroid 5-alpha reductase family enzyme